MEAEKKKKIIKVATFGALAVVLCAIVYAVVFSVVVKIKDKNSMPMPFGFGASLVLSGSMEPEISTDDLVFVRKPGELHVGDVILYYDAGGSRVLHRITYMDGNKVITKGDANNTEDKPISSEAVLGVYTGRIPGAGKVIRFVTNPPFVMAVIFILMMAAIAWIFIEERNERKKLDGIRAEIYSIKAENEELRKKL